MSGLEIVGVLGAVETCIHGCQQVHRLIRSYRHIDNDVVDLDLRLEEAISYLWSFARIHNLIVEDDNQRASGPRAATDASPSWKQLADKRLVLARDHIEHARQILSKYETGRQATKSQTLESQSANGTELFGTSILPTESRNLERTNTTLVSRRASLKKVPIVRKLTWSTTDKHHLTEAVTQFEHDVQALVNLTMPKFWIIMHEAAASALRKRLENDPLAVPPEALRSISSSLDDDQRIAQELHAHQLVKDLEAESQKQKESRIIVDFAKSFPELVQVELPSDPVRSVTKYVRSGSSEPVLIEWKGYDPKEITRDAVISRVSDVVCMLNSSPTFLHNVLPSVGFFEDTRSNNHPLNWVGIAYNTSPLGNKRNIRTLRDLLSRPSGPLKTASQEIWKPPLGHRFKLALRIAETLMTTQNCGWMHKGIRPENIVFFTVSQKSVTDPYLLGWEYSRSGEKGQKTEPIRTWNTDSDLYQHPDYFVEVTGPEESRYKPYFDHYQLGCVLLEIGMWRLLGDLGRRKDIPIDDEWRRMWRLKLKDKAARLAVDMGEIYSGVVLDLLTGLNEHGEERNFWDAVVLQLKQCCA